MLLIYIDGIVRMLFANHKLVGGAYQSISETTAASR